MTPTEQQLNDAVEKIAEKLYYRDYKVLQTRTGIDDITDGILSELKPLFDGLVKDNELRKECFAVMSYEIGCPPKLDTLWINKDDAKWRADEIGHPWTVDAVPIREQLSSAIQQEKGKKV